MSDAILSTKNAILSSGGTKYNDLYYSMANSSVSLLECTFGYQNIITLPSLQFGSSSQINIPIDQFIGEIILHLRLPNLQANETLCRAWGYAMLQSIGYTFGNSNSTQIVLQGQSILQSIISQISDPMKRLEAMRLAGEEHLAPLIAQPGEDTPTVDAYLVIPLPFSTMCDKLPVDSTMLSTNITININFNQNPTTIYGGSATHPTSFLRAEVMLRQGKLSNQAASIRGKMLAEPELSYAYPFIHTQYFQSSLFQGKRESDGYQGCSVDLNAFPNADLVGISFFVVKDTDVNPTGGNSPNPFNADDISNVLVTFNGSTLFNLPAKSYKLTNMALGEQSASYYGNSIIAAGTANPFISYPKDCYMVYLDFARARSMCMHSHFFNTFRLPNQVLRIQFNTTLGSSTNYRLYGTYYMNGVVEFKNGTSAIRID